MTNMFKPPSVPPPPTPIAPPTMPDPNSPEAMAARQSAMAKASAGGRTSTMLTSLAGGLGAPAAGARAAANPGAMTVAAGNYGGSKAGG